MKIGSLDVSPVLDGHLIAGVRFSKQLPDQAALEPHCGMFRADGRIECRIGAILVRSGERIVLIDAGAGRTHICEGKHSHGFERKVGALLAERQHSTNEIAGLLANFSRMELNCGGLPDDLARIGVLPEEVTDVVFTHLHFDHIGWATLNGRPFFPNATYHAPRADLVHFNGSTFHERMNEAIFECASVPDMLAPVLDRMKPWDGDTVIAPGVTVRIAAGHTPGNSIVILHSEDQRAMLLGDVVHCPLELMDVEFNMIGDFDHALANKVREAISREIEGTATIVSAAHFPGAHFGRLLAGKGMRGWAPLAEANTGKESHVRPRHR